MMDWCRKHVAELVSVCKLYEDDTALTSAQRTAFAKTYSLASRLASLPNAGGSANIVTAKTMACSACHGAFQFQCASRTDWQQPCRLVQERTRQSYCKDQERPG
jgi:hypothetical protein